jgi:HEAT repeat protein
MRRLQSAVLALLVVATVLTRPAAATQAASPQVPARPPAAQAPGARRPGALPIDESTTMTQGWAFLAQGDLARAAQKAGEAMAKAPRSAAPVALAIEVEFARTGAASGLDVYERWLGGRVLEEPALLRRVATVFLQEFAQQPQNPTARFEALRVLGDEGDRTARAALSAAAAEGGGAETRALAATGDQAAVKSLLTELGMPRPPAAASLVALGKSRSPLAMAALTSKLAELRPEVRGAAAEGLGWLGSAEAIKVLKPLLNDPSSHVKMKAAEALYRLNDSSGFSILQASAAGDSPSGQLAAAEAMAVRPDANWQTLVRRLTQAAEPDVRLAAARLIAPHDPALAASVFQSLSTDPNLAVREEANRSLAREGAFDLPSLRLLLKHTDRMTRVYAATSVIRLTR